MQPFPGDTMFPPISSGAMLAGNIGYIKRFLIIFVICFAFMTMMSVLAGSYVYQSQPGLGAAIGILGSLVGGTSLGIIMGRRIA